MGSGHRTTHFATALLSNWSSDPNCGCKWKTICIYFELSPYLIIRLQLDLSVNLYSKMGIPFWKRATKQKIWAFKTNSAASSPPPSHVSPLCAYLWVSWKLLLLFLEHLIWEKMMLVRLFWCTMALLHKERGTPNNYDDVRFGLQFSKKDEWQKGIKGMYVLYVWWKKHK